MTVPWNLAVAMLCGYGAGRRNDIALLVKLRWLSRNGVGSRGMRKFAK